MGVSWQSCRFIFTDHGKSVSARLFFDDAGRPTDFVTQRYREINGDFSLDTWSTPFTKYGVHAGLSLPTHGQAVWKLPSGDLPYADLEIAELEYNQAVEV